MLVLLNYTGDAARVFYGRIGRPLACRRPFGQSLTRLPPPPGDRLLTDNWYTGYKDDGALQVGLTYLAEEVGLPLGSDTPFTLQLHVLPLKKETLPNLVYMNPEGIPPFDASGLALRFSSSDVSQHVFRYASFRAESARAVKE